MCSSVLFWILHRVMKIGVVNFVHHVTLPHNHMLVAIGWMGRPGRGWAWIYTIFTTYQFFIITYYKILEYGTIVIPVVFGIIVTHKRLKYSLYNIISGIINLQEGDLLQFSRRLFLLCPYSSSFLILILLFFPLPLQLTEFIENLTIERWRWAWPKWCCRLVQTCLVRLLRHPMRDLLWVCWTFLCNLYYLFGLYFGLKMGMLGYLLGYRTSLMNLQSEPLDRFKSIIALTT